MKKIIAILFIMIMSVGLANAQQKSAVPLQADTLKNRVITVPAGNKFRGVFLSPLSSETAYAGQEVALALAVDFYYNDKRIAPAGSTVTGSVIEVAKAKHGALDGKLLMRFTHILTPSGVDIPISAIVDTADNTGVIIGSKRGNFNNQFSSSTNTGESLLNVRDIAPVNVNTSLRGNVLMPALGQGGGLVKSIWDKGTDVEIQVNTGMEFVLTQPITLNPLADEN